MCKLIVVTNRKLCKRDFLEQIRLLVECNADAIVLREKDLNAKEYQKLAKDVLAICKGSKTKCILHQFLPVAKDLMADAIHLSVPDAIRYRKELSSFALKGMSTHSVEQLQKAQELGADYVFYGHIFTTDCKKGLKPRGITALQQICKEAQIPVYAIGGISSENVKEVIQAGAAGACIMSFGMQASKEELLQLKGIK